MTGNMALSTAIANGSKEYAIKKPTDALKPQEEAATLSQGLRESGVEWFLNEDSGLGLSNRISDNDFLMTSSTTDIAVRIAKSGVFSKEMFIDLKKKFKGLFVSAYSNIFSHNRLLSKISEWMVGNVIERLVLLGISPQELGDIKTNIRTELIAKNQTAMSQVFYDETMLEIVA